MGSADDSPPEPAGDDHETVKQIRGSSLLLSGRVVALGLNFAVQILIVRYLSKTSYGAFAYGLSLATLGETAATFGLDRAVTRFLPIYQERKEFARMLGVLVIVVSSMVTLGLAFILVGFGFRGLFAGSFIGDSEATTVILILIFLAPLQALDQVVVGVLSVLGKAKAIFFRNFLLAPGLRLAAVLALMIGRADVVFLAAGYLAAGFFGVGFYGTVVIRSLRSIPGLRGVGIRGARLPWHDVLWFTVPLFSTDLVQAAVSSLGPILLGQYHSAADVASFKAIQPVAKLNLLVFTSFGLLYVPAATRLFVRRNREAAHRLYWQTALWVAVLSFPVFAVTAVFAGPLAVLFFGTQYQDSGTLLTILAVGYYFNASLGFNGMTLNVYGRVWYVVAISFMVVAVNVVGSLLLIPPLGALGAAVATSGTLILHNVLKQIGLHRGTSVRGPDLPVGRVYLVITLLAGALLVVLTLLQIPLVGEVALVGGASLLVLGVSRHQLALADTFPELAKYRLLRFLTGPRAKSD